MPANAARFRMAPYGPLSAMVWEGANGGNIASRVAITEMQNQLQERYNPAEDEKGIQNLLLSCIYGANEKVFHMAQTQPELSGMGTTVVGAVVRQKPRLCGSRRGTAVPMRFRTDNCSA